jgi:phasin
MLMAEAVATSVKSKAKSAASSAPQLEAAFPAVEPPAAFREFAEKSLSQARDGYERMRSIAEETTAVIEDTYASTTRGAADYGLKLIDVARANSNAAFEYATELLRAKTMADLVELTTAHARRQFDAMSAQARELTALAQKVTTEAAEPLKEGMSRVVKKVA